MSQRLVVDLGGTNARFALVPEGAPFDAATEVAREPLSAHDSFAEALAAFAGARHMHVTSATIAAAGPVETGPTGETRVQLTNAPWVLEQAAVAEHLGGADVALFNDLEAVALALPWLRVGDAAPIRPGDGVPGAACLVLNIGTGFGGAVALQRGGGWHALAAEPGHMRFAAVTEAERALLDMIETVEDICSGRGIATLYGRLSGVARGGPTAEEIVARVRTDPTARAVRDLMLSVAGRVAGDLVLATGAWGGVWLTGGVVSAWEVDWTEPFLEHFAYKGPMTQRMRRVPVHRVLHPCPALLGLSRVPIGG